MTTPSHPSGRQYELRVGDQQATIVEVGGGIREYSVGGRAVLNPYGVNEICEGAHGTPLIPWPNRLADGQYSFDGIDYQVALTEPAKRNAIHGFLRWRSWDLVERSDTTVTMGTTIHPMTGYPFLLQVRITYSLGEDGLTVTTTAKNLGTVACPYGTGHHPYLSPGTGTIDACKLQLEADTRVATDGVRQLPTGLEPVAETAYDFREPRVLGSQTLDHAFTDLKRDSSGRAWVRLTGADGRTAQTWVDGHYPLIQLFTADTLSADYRRKGLGTEPMSCPPNAFQTGESVIRLEPEESVTMQWGALLD